MELGSAAAASAAGVSTPAQLVQAVSAQRAANMIPADISVNNTWSAGCQQLDLYEHQNGDNFAHTETPGAPGYTQLGDRRLIDHSSIPGKLENSARCRPPACYAM